MCFGYIHDEESRKYQMSFDLYQSNVNCMHVKDKVKNHEANKMMKYSIIVCYQVKFSPLGQGSGECWWVWWSLMSLILDQIYKLGYKMRCLLPVDITQWGITFLYISIFYFIYIYFHLDLLSCSSSFQRA